MVSKYGHFNQDGSEFIITEPDIPRNWYNYISFMVHRGKAGKALRWNESFVNAFIILIIKKQGISV